MKKEDILRSKFKEYINLDTAMLTTEELLQLLESKKGILHTSTLKSFVDTVLHTEYQGLISQYVKSVEDSICEVIELIKDFEESKDEKKYGIYKEIVGIFQSKDVVFADNGLTNYLVSVIEYGFKIEDVHAVALLMRKRKEILDVLFGYELKQEQTWKTLDSQKLYKPFIKMTVEQCDEETTNEYIQALSQGKYLMLEYTTERFGWKITPKDIYKTYEVYKAINSAESGESQKEIIE